MKLGAKRAELVQLVQKFVPQSRIRIFRNEHAQCSPYDPKLIFWHVSCFGAFHSVWVRLESFFYCRKLGAKWAELVQLLQKIVQIVASEFLQQTHHMTPLDTKLMFCCVS